MNKINNSEALQARILALEVKSNEEGTQLKSELCHLVDNIHPIQLLKSGIKEVINSPELKSDLVGISLGMGAGYISKKILIGKSASTLQNVAGNLFGMLVSKNVFDHAEGIQSNVYAFLKNFIGKKPKEETNKSLDE